MTNTVFPMFQSQYILDFSSASHNGTLVFARFSSLKMSLQYKARSSVTQKIVSANRYQEIGGILCKKQRSNGIVSI
jgi:hypothetical protein